MLEEVIRMVLEYLRAWELQYRRHQVGSSRSAVRAIGASLPWTPDRTPSLNIPASADGSSRRSKSSRRHSIGNQFQVASFADVGWVHSDDYEVAYTPGEKETPAAENDGNPELAEEDADEESAAEPSASDPQAMAKISALEVELATLRAQLAMVVKHQEASTPPQPCASVAMATPPCPAVAPPPPPPPPPPSLITPEPVNVIELIRKNRAARDGRPVGNTSRDDEKLDMAQVIKQMGSVKLRTVQRSPGGTPVRQKPLTDANDPASIIANALQRKFAKTIFVDGTDDDSDSENFPSPKAKVPRRVVSPRRGISKSPLGKMPFGQHLLRSRAASKN